MRCNANLINISNFIIISIELTYSAWYIPLCILFALGVTWFLYYKDDKLKSVKKTWIWVLSSFRFIFLFFILFFLLSPLIKTITNFIDKPLIVIATDNSESMVLNSDSNEIRNNFNATFSRITDELSNDYDIQQISFGDSVRKNISADFKDKTTDFSQLFDYINRNFTDRNLGAVVIVSDGIFNKGNNPVYETENISVPVYTIAIGDSVAKKDIYLREALYNKMAFVSTKFPLRLFCSATGFSDIATKINIIHKNKIIAEKDLIIKTDNFNENIDFELEANETGLQQYTIEIIPAQGESNIRNNSKKIIVDVIDNRQKILILSNAPHPDAGALKNALKQNMNFETESYTIDKFKNDIGQYNLIILNQLPSASNPATQIFNDIQKKQIPTLLIVGGQTNLQQLNNLKTGLTIAQSRQNFDEARPSLSDQFTLFEISNDMKKFFQDVSPLITPFGEVKINPSATVFFTQKIKTVTTSKPLMFFDNSLGVKTGVILGEGIWHWELDNYQQKQNHLLFNEFVNKIAQYLALKLNKNNFIVNIKRMFNENEPVFFEAQLYNESFELITEPDVSLEISDANNKKYNFQFDRMNNSYRLNAGAFSEGIYNYVANTTYGGKTYTNKGSFSVLPLNIESENLVANHNVLYKIAHDSNGKMIAFKQSNTLASEIKKSENILPKIYNEKYLEDLINVKWLLLVILLFVSFEWFLRKYLGSY